MSLTQKKYGFMVGSHWVEVLGETKAVHPKWSVLIDGESADTKNLTGEFQLSATVDGKHLSVDIAQGGFGDVNVTVELDNSKIQEFSGFLL